MCGESWYDEHSPYDLRNEGFIGNSWKKSNKGKEQYQSWHIWLLLPKRLHPIVTTNNLFNENKNQSSEASKKKTHLGSKKENSRFASMRDQEHFLRSTWNFLERYQNSGNLCKSNWFKGTIEFVGNSWKSILPWAPLDSSPQASTFPSPHLRRGKSTFNHIMVVTIFPQKF